MLYGNDLQLNLFIWLFLIETSCNGSQELILRRQDWVLRALLFERLQIDLVTVFDAILTSRQTCEKLYENLMSNNFRKTAVLKKIAIVD